MESIIHLIENIDKNLKILNVSTTFTSRTSKKYLNDIKNKNNVILIIKKNNVNKDLFYEKFENVGLFLYPFHFLFVKNGMGINPNDGFNSAKKQDGSDKKDQHFITYVSNIIEYDKSDFIHHIINNSIGIENKDINNMENESDKNGYIKEICYKYLISLIFTNLKTYVNYLKLSVETIKKDPYAINKNYGFNDIINDKVIKIDETNKDIINKIIYDRYENIIRIKDYFAPGFCRNVNVHTNCSYFILCKAKNYNNENKSWNIFLDPGKNDGYDEIGIDEIKNLFEYVNIVSKLEKVFIDK